MKHIKYIILPVLFFAINGCSVYNFTGAKPINAKTFQVNYFQNNADLIEPGIERKFTQDLQNLIQNQTNLSLTNSGGDLLYEGEITDYNITPTSIGAATTSTTGTNTVQAQQNKLTITVKVHYENSKDPTLSFDRTYSDEAVFNSDLDLNTIETAQVKIVNERIIVKIFNDIVANW